MIYRMMSTKDLQVLMKETGLRIVRGYPELKTQHRCVLVSKDANYMTVEKVEGNFFKTRFVKHDPTSNKGYSQGGTKSVMFWGKKYPLHKLVASTWLEKPSNPKKTLVCFKNGDYRDIRADNLEWTSRRLSTMFSARYRKPRTFKGKWQNGFWIKEDKSRVPMTREEYLEMIAKERGAGYARKIERDRLDQQKRKRSNSV